MKSVTIESPREGAQRQERGDDPQAAVLESEQIVDQSQRGHRAQQGRGHDAQSIDGRHPPHAAPQGSDLLFERMSHGSRFEIRDLRFEISHSQFYTIPRRFRNIHSAISRPRNNASTGHLFHSGSGGSDSMGTWRPGGKSANRRSAVSNV